MNKLEYEYYLEMIDICKEFPGVKALNSASIKVRKGTVHALMGENGAGKSTLMKILGGIVQQDSGVILINGKEIKISSPNDSINLGISMIHQELTSINEMTVAENIFIGREPSYRNIWVSEKDLYKKTQELLDKMNIKLDPRKKMKNLSTAQKQLVEIAKAISFDSSIIIMDEPTSAITERETEQLYITINNLKHKGVAIIYISHKLNEIFKIADEVTVMRDGEFIGRKLISDLTEQDIVTMMVGRELKNLFPKIEVEIKEEIFKVKNFTCRGKFENISFYLKKGEILGLFGLMGAGRSELVECIFGLVKYDTGEIYIRGKRRKIKRPSDALRLGISFIPEDRKLTGLVLVLPVKDNIIASSLDKFKGVFFMKHKKINCVSEEYRKKLSIKTPSINTLVQSLSGGNQQKVLLAKSLLVEPDILIMDEPTRGIDVGAKSEIHALMGKLVSEGKSIIMISSELPEILGMSDRILIMHEGKLKGEVNRSEANQEVIMRYATGITDFTTAIKS